MRREPKHWEACHVIGCQQTCKDTQQIHDVNRALWTAGRCRGRREGQPHSAANGDLVGRGLFGHRLRRSPRFRWILRTLVVGLCSCVECRSALNSIALQASHADRRACRARSGDAVWNCQSCLSACRCAVEGCAAVDELLRAVAAGVWLPVYIDWEVSCSSLQVVTEVPNQARNALERSLNTTPNISRM